MPQHWQAYWQTFRDQMRPVATCFAHGKGFQIDTSPVSTLMGDPHLFVRNATRGFGRRLVRILQIGAQRIIDHGLATDSGRFGVQAKCHEYVVG